MLFLPGEKVTLSPKKKVVKSEKITPREEVEKYIKCFNDIKKALVTRLRKDLDNFDGQSIG